MCMLAPPRARDRCALSLSCVLARARSAAAAAQDGARESRPADGDGSKSNRIDPSQIPRPEAVRAATTPLHPPKQLACAEQVRLLGERSAARGHGAR
eukprot:5007314-Pleurochrysis_carterae.AAC.1